MILKNDNIEQKPKKAYGKRPINYDKTVTLRMKSETLEELKEICGEYSYQAQIRDLIVDYIRRHKFAYTQEQERRNKMLGKKA